MACGTFEVEHEEDPVERPGEEEDPAAWSGGTFRRLCRMGSQGLKDAASTTPNEDVMFTDVSPMFKDRMH